MPWQAILEQLLASAVAAEVAAADSRLSMFGLASARKYWASAGKKGLEDNRLFTVAAGSVEYNAIATEFAKTLPRATLDKLERVENGYLHEGFQLQAKTLQMQVGAADYNADTMRYGALLCENKQTQFYYRGYAALLFLLFFFLFFSFFFLFFPFFSLFLFSFFFIPTHWLQLR